MYLCDWTNKYEISDLFLPPSYLSPKVKDRTNSLPHISAIAIYFLCTYWVNFLLEYLFNYKRQCGENPLTLLSWLMNVCSMKISYDFISSFIIYVESNFCSRLLFSSRFKVVMPTVSLISYVILMSVPYKEKFNVAVLIKNTYVINVVSCWTNLVILQSSLCDKEGKHYSIFLVLCK